MWHKWDIHIHSPLSALNNQFPKISDGSPDWDAYIGALSQLVDIPAIAITDYFSVEGYKAVFAARAAGKLPNLHLVMPNIEFRIDKLINTKNGYKRLNYHVLFSDEVTPQDIEDHFLHEIKFEYEGDPQQTDLSLPTRRINLEFLGKRLKQEHAHFNDRSDFEIGCLNATVDPSKIKEVLQNKSRIFAGKYLILLPEEHLCLLEWDGQDHLTRKLLLQGADAILSKNPKTVAWALGGGTVQGGLDFIKEFKTFKPCIGGSDAHEIAKIGKPDQDRFCWIKADLTFEGLKQVLYEPRARVYLGDIPPNLKNDYQVIESVVITDSPNWFGNIDVPLNCDLVSVIGPRGSGKSALAEMIALAGGSNLFRGSGDLKDTFLAKASKRSPSNAAPVVGTKISLKWRDGHDSQAIIDQSLLTPREEEEVKYLPQKFVEWLCAPENNRELEDEIERVIYQRHQKGAQSDASNFQDLRRNATQALQTRRQRFGQTIKALNQSIASKSSQIDELPAKQADLVRKKTELEAVIKLAPAIPEANKVDVDSLGVLQAKRQKLTERLSQLMKQLTTLDTITARYENMAADIAQFNSGVKELFDGAGMKEIEGFLLPAPSEGLVPALQERRTVINAEAVTIQGGDEASDQTIAGIDKIVAGIRTNLTMTEAKQKEYDKNQADRKKLEAAATALERDIKEINEVIKTKRQNENQERVEAFLDAIDLLGKETEVLQGLYQPLHDALASSNNMAKKLGFVSNVVFDITAQAAKGMGLLDRRKSTVRDEDTLRAILAKYFEEIVNGGFDREVTRTSVDQLPKTIAGNTPIKGQLRGERTTRDFADWLFDIEPYHVNYTLEYDGKDLKYLSPGEKGIVLLLLYLEAEEEDHRPLIIDQPDDNLDNLSIYPSLIQYFRERKQTRQIVIITHNPNLVVTTDSEQVIVGSFDGSRIPKIQYRSGSLENTHAEPDTGIREEVCHILEGGVTAFQIRENRYALSEQRAVVG